MIRKNFLFIIKCSLSFLVIGIFYTIFSTKYYESYISIYPEHDSNINNSLSNISTIVNMDLFNQSNNSKIYIPDVVNSRRLKLDIVNNLWNSNKSSDSINLIEYWGLNKKSIFNINLFKTSSDDSLTSSQKLEHDAIKKLENCLYVLEEESGLIRVRVLMEEAQLSADIANYIAQFLVKYIGTELKLQSTKYREFLEQRLKEVEANLELAEMNLINFRNINPRSKDTPELQNLRGQLIRSLEVEQQVYLTLRTQYEVARADELKEQPVINILDNGYPSLYPYWPKNVLIYLISLFTGFMLSIVIISSRDALSKKT